MAGKTIEEILHWENLMGVIQDPAGGIPENLVPPGFLSTSRDVEGDTGEYLKVEGNRELARLVHYGDPSRRRNQEGVTPVTVKLCHTHEHIFHGVSVLNQLRSYDNPQRQILGIQEIGRKTADFRRLFNNLRLACLYAALAKGVLYFDADGNLKLSTSTGFAVDYGIPAANKTQLNVLGGGNIIATTWDNVAADIVGQIENLKQAALKLTGYPLQYAFYGPNVLGYLLRNTTLQTAVINANPAYASSFAQLVIPPGFLGLTWVPVASAFYVDEAGAMQSFWPDDQVTFTPEPSPDWWEWLQGSFQIPTTLGGISEDGVGALNDLATVYGQFSYAKITDDPVGIKHNAGDTFLPVIKVPKAVFIADVKFP